LPWATKRPSQRRGAHATTDGKRALGQWHVRWPCGGDEQIETCRLVDADARGVFGIVTQPAGVWPPPSGDVRATQPVAELREVALVESPKGYRTAPGRDSSILGK
jgi:hypothetical protein